MAEVTGSITGQTGTHDVHLNNAATEATLKLLLQSSLSANKQSLDNIKSLAQKSLGPESVAAANKGLVQVSTGSATLGSKFKLLDEAATGTKTAFNEIIALSEKLTSGSAQASDVFASLSKLPLGIGLVASGFQKLALFQESNLKAYQEMTNAGVNFGGSLVDLRLAASASYLTLTEFTNLMKRNGEAFAKMGNSADDGARSFVGLSNSLLKSPVGDNLRALGYTSEQVNEGLAAYLTNTGARTAQEMKNTTEITKGAAEYLTQLDALATITGKSREEQEKALKQANANAAYEQMKMGMTEKQRAAYDKGLAEMSAKFGKAGEDLFKSQAMGLPPMTDAARKLAALSPEVAKASQGMADIGKRGGTVAETYRKSSEATEGAVQAAKRFSGVAGALSFSTDSTGQALMGLTAESNRAKAQSVTTTAEGEVQRRLVADAQAKRQASEADAAAKSQKAINELGQSILNQLIPVILAATPMLNKLITGLADSVRWLTEHQTVLKTLVGIIGLTTLAFVGFKAMLIASQAKAAIDRVTTSGIAGLGAVGSKVNPMYVYVVNQGAGDSILDQLTGEKGKGKGGKGKGKGGKLMGGLKAGAIGTAISAAMLYSDISDINEQLASGKISSGEAGTAKGGAYGSAAGGALGAVAGQMLIPIPVVGAVVGGYVGSKIGEMAGEKIAGPSSAAPATPAPPTPAVTSVAPASEESLRGDVQRLNNTMNQVLSVLRTTIADNTNRTVTAVNGLNGNLWARK